MEKPICLCTWGRQHTQWVNKLCPVTKFMWWFAWFLSDQKLCMSRTAIIVYLHTIRTTLFAYLHILFLATTTLAIQAPRSRETTPVLSQYIRELSADKLLISSKRIRLMDTVGHGETVSLIMSYNIESMTMALIVKCIGLYFSKVNLG